MCLPVEPDPPTSGGAAWLTPSLVGLPGSCAGLPGLEVARGVEVTNVPD
jgi:hypothetical protein